MISVKEGRGAVVMSKVSVAMDHVMRKKSHKGSGKSCH